MPIIKKLAASTFAACAAIVTAGTAYAQSMDLEFITSKDLGAKDVSNQAFSSQVKPVIFLSEMGVFKPEAKTEEASWVQLTSSEIAELDKDVVPCQPCVAGSSSEDGSNLVCAAVPVKDNKIIYGYKAATDNLTFNEEDVQCFCPMVAINPDTNNMSVDTESLAPIFDWEAEAKTASCFAPMSKHIGNGIGSGTVICSDDCGDCFSFANILALFNEPFGGRLGYGGASFGGMSSGRSSARSMPEGAAPVSTGTAPNDYVAPVGGDVLPILNPYDPNLPVFPKDPYINLGQPIIEHGGNTPSAVPEPGAHLLFGVGAAVLAGVARRRKYKVKQTRLSLG